MHFSDGEIGKGEAEGFFVSSYDAPNCKKFNINVTLLRQGQQISYRRNGKVSSIEKGLFDCRLSLDNKPLYAMWEGIIDQFEVGERQIFFKNDAINVHIYAQLKNKEWIYVTRNVDTAFFNHPNANTSRRPATKNEIEHAEKLYKFYKNLDLSSRSAKNYKDKILTNTDPTVK